MSDEVLTERRGRVLVITLNRPDQMNSINTALAKGLVAAIEELDGDPGLSLGVLTGAGRGFSAGMDLKAFAKEGTPQGFETYIEKGSQKPMIAAIEGFCLARVGAGRADREERATVAEGNEGGATRHGRAHRRGVLGDADPAHPLRVHLRRREGGPPGLRREAPAGVVGELKRHGIAPLV